VVLDGIEHAGQGRACVADAVADLTGLVRVTLTGEVAPEGHCPLPGIAGYLKDEPTHPTGSVKHRLVRNSGSKNLRKDRQSRCSAMPNEHAMSAERCKAPDQMLHPTSGTS